MKTSKWLFAISVTMALIGSRSGFAQVQRNDTTVINLAGLEQYKKDRTAGKAMQLIGSLGLGAHFLLQSTYENKVLDGNLNAKRPPKALPIAACALMTVGISVDMGAISYFIRKKKKAVMVDTNRYDF